MKEPSEVIIQSSKNRLPPGYWFIEWFSRNEFHGHKITKIITVARSPFQNIKLIKTLTFGKCLVIDKETQSSQLDESFYHESLVYPALLMHPRPACALILGGGEGATARDVLNSKTIKKVVMLDIDYCVLEFAKKHLKTWHNGCFDDMRLRVLVENAKKYVSKTCLKFDLIYSDLPSPQKGGPAFDLYTLEFYKKIKRILNANGVFVTQSGPGTPLKSQFNLHIGIANTLQKVFKVVRSYFVFIPSYDMPWTFTYCTDEKKLDLFMQKKSSIDNIIKKRLKTKPKFIDGITIEGFVRIPKYYRNLIRANKKIITLKRPMFFTTSQKGRI
jgi:spermidine synthase